MIDKLSFALGMVLIFLIDTTIYIAGSESLQGNLRVLLAKNICHVKWIIYVIIALILIIFRYS